jgi:hypothetical protein
MANSYSSLSGIANTSPSLSEMANIYSSLSGMANIYSSLSGIANIYSSLSKDVELIAIPDKDEYEFAIILSILHKIYFIMLQIRNYSFVVRHAYVLYALFIVIYHYSILLVTSKLN